MELQEDDVQILASTTLIHTQSTKRPFAIPGYLPSYGCQQALFEAIGGEFLFTHRHLSKAFSDMRNLEHVPLSLRIP